MWLAGIVDASPLIAKTQSTESVEVEFDEDGPEFVESKSFPQIDELFKNPALVSGLASGADAINRSIESLMESLFYSLLDNEIRWPLTAHSDFAAGMRRDVYSASLGAQVVVDRIDFGPRWSRELWRVQKLPIVLGADGTVDILDIYLRTDGMRVAEQVELPFWRIALNNWFGVLPLLSSVLPPSFNSNELYDPVRQLSTPFVFPLSLASFSAMPVGSIRSWGISGGVNIGIDLGAFADQSMREMLLRAEELGHGIPYSIFRQGQHRVNVLKKSDQVAWVGLTKMSRLGHSITPSIGRTLLVFRNVLPLWPGMGVALWPVDVKLEQAVSDRFDQLYEFDLTYPEAQEAYQAAVKGDFAPSWAAHLRRTEQKIETGVVFHFTKNQRQKEDIGNNSRNFAVERQSREQLRTAAEVEIRDQMGVFHVLEARQDTEDEGWDILVGSEEVKYRDEVELKVVKVQNSADTPNEDLTPYVFSVDRSPIQMSTSLDIQDRYTSTEQLERYLEALRFFTNLPLDDLPRFTLRDGDWESLRRRKIWFDTALDPPNDVHVPPTALGRFSAQAAVSFSSDFMNRISSLDPDVIWKAFAEAWGVDVNLWATHQNRSSVWNDARWIPAFFAYPLRLLNVRFARADALREATRAIQALESLKIAKSPMAKRDAFYDLFDTDWPQFLTRALLLLRGADDVPRRVILSTQSKGNSPPGAKQKFSALNGRTWRSTVPFPQPERYRIAQEKLAAFSPGSVRELGRKPVITRMVVQSQRLGLSEMPDGHAELPLDLSQRHILMRLEVRNMDLLDRGKIYIRFEQSGKIQFGKLELAEKVLDLVPTSLGEKGPSGLDRLAFGIWLTGPVSPLRSFVFDQAVDLGGEFRVSVAASRDGIVWSDEKSVRFQYDSGRLSPPDH
jgi:hypothetical protein